GHHRHARGRGRRAMTGHARAARIVLVTAQTTGGIGRHVSSLLPELLNRGARVEVAAPRATGGLGAEAAGTAFWPVEIPRLPSPMPAVSALRELKRALDGADLVHAHGVRASPRGERGSPRAPEGFRRPRRGDGADERQFAAGRRDLRGRPRPHGPRGPDPRPRPR